MESGGERARRREGSRAERRRATSDEHHKAFAVGPIAAPRLARKSSNIEIAASFLDLDAARSLRSLYST